MDLPLLVTNPTNVQYLTGFVGVAPEEREAYCLVTRSHTYLITNPLYTEYATNLMLLSKRGSNNPIIQLSNKPINKTVTKLVTSLGMKKLGFEENDLTVAEHHKIMLEHKNVRLIPTQDRIEQLRMMKRDDEIIHIKAAARLTDQCFDFILKKMKPDVTEREIAWKIESFIRAQGAEVAFSPIVAFGRNTSQPHYSPNFTRPRLQIEARQGEALKTQDIILFDFGARVNGYCSDMTRVVFVGKAKAEWVEAYSVVLQAQTAALQCLASRPGLERRGNTVDRIARDVIKKAGFPAYPHSLGHGVGLDIHEAPRLTIKKDQELKPGMVVTVEPAIYKEGSYGIRIEDLVVLKEDGVEVLSKTRKSMNML